MTKLKIQSDIPSGRHINIATKKDGKEKLSRIELNKVEHVVMGVLIEQFLDDRGIEYDDFSFDGDLITAVILRGIKELAEESKEGEVIDSLQLVFH